MYVFVYSKLETSVHQNTPEIELKEKQICKEHLKNKKKKVEKPQQENMDSGFKKKGDKRDIEVTGISLLENMRFNYFSLITFAKPF